MVYVYWHAHLKFTQRKRIKTSVSSHASLLQTSVSSHASYNDSDSLLLSWDKNVIWTQYSPSDMIYILKTLMHWFLDKLWNHRLYVCARKNEYVGSSFVFFTFVLQEIRICFFVIMSKILFRSQYLLVL